MQLVHSTIIIVSFVVGNACFRIAIILHNFVGTCTHGAIRLVNGTYSDEGRVEVCINGVWGTVTSDWWNVPDAKVACRQLGYTDKCELETTTITTTTTNNNNNI